MLSVGSQIHNVFHVSHLRKCLGYMVTVLPELPPMSVTCTILSQLELVLDHHVIQKGQYQPKTKVLIKWKGVVVEDAI